MAIEQVRYKRLGYVALNVSDLEKSRAFYVDMVGLEDMGQIDGDIFLRCSHSHHDIILCAAGSQKPGLKRVGWQMESAEAIDAVADSLERAGLDISPVPAEETARLGIGPAIRSIDPVTGAMNEFFAHMDFARDEFTHGHTRLEGLGHVVLATPDLPASERFYCDTLNFRISDRISDRVLHMRCFPNPLHHSFGLGAAPSAQLHHLTFMVHHVDDIGCAQKRMTDHQVPIVYGPGRHPQSGSFFFYFLDPDGLTLEYSQGMEEFSERDPRPPRNFDLQVESIDYWGNRPKPGFAKCGEIETVEELVVT
ncbi:VOC family protein [soil metagenome]